MKKIILSLFMGAAICSCAKADDAAQTELRLNPEIEAARISDIDYNQYKFIDIKNNTIALNDADWSELAHKYQAAARGDSLFSVVYLGDSHIQADFGGDVLRKRLQANARSAGRGLIIPFRLAGTNQPVDYTIESDCACTGARLLKTPWPVDITFSGIGVAFEDSIYNLRIKAKTPFRYLNVHYAGGITHSLDLENNIDSIELTLENRGSLAGIDLRSDSVGVLVHSIGNNGAEYASYNALGGFGKDIARLTPDLIIIALGTNEAFGTTTAEEMADNIDGLVRELRSENPQAQLLLVGAAECYKTKRVYRRKRRTTAQVVNTKVYEMRNEVKKYARNNGIAFYDHYAVASGGGAAARMKVNAVLGKDGVHYTVTGYRLWGNLLSDALLEQLNK